jgi:hypothetical protein
MGVSHQEVNTRRNGAETVSSSSPQQGFRGEEGEVGQSSIRRQKAHPSTGSHLSTEAGPTLCARKGLVEKQTSKRVAEADGNCLTQ